MKIVLSWLKEYVDIDIPLEELAEKLTLAGLEVNGIERIGETWDRETILVGEVVHVDPHPNADRLKLPTVRYGEGRSITMVTGAPNIYPGQSGVKVALALAGARLIDGHSETRRMITLKPSKIRGVESAGMVCSELELGISDEHEGIMILPDDAPVGMPLVDYLGDVVLDIDLTPNLSRCFSVTGVAREVAAILGKPARVPAPTMQATGAPIEGQIELEIAAPDLCARYSAALIKGVKIAPSPWWLQRRLSLVGMRPINNIVDITNYVMLEWGQPLHAFDYRCLRPRPGQQTPPAIIVRRAAPGEVMHTLDGVERKLQPDMLLITDGQGPVAVAGVMGGLGSEVSEETVDVLLESATFDFINNRRTSQLMRLTSEASIRFGRGIPSSRTVKAARRAIELMRQLAGGEVAAGLADTYPVPQQEARLTITAGGVQRMLGLSLTPREIAALLERLEFTCIIAGDSIEVAAPEHRLDIAIPADVYEEVARVYGFDRIPTTALSDALPPQRRNIALEAEEQVRDLLAGCGLQEIISYSLTNLAAEGRVAPGHAPDPAGHIKLANPLSSEREYMRRSLKASILDTLANNLRQSELVTLFEVAAVYHPVAGQQLPDEPRRLAIALSGPRSRQAWLAPAGEPMDFFDLKGIVEELLEHLIVPGVSFAPIEELPFQPGRAAVVTAGGQIIGQMGEVHPVVREKFDLPAQPVCLAEFDLDALLAMAERVTRVQPVSRFPGVAQDLAVVVDEGTPAETVRQVILKAGGALLIRLDLFDVYRGLPIPAGKKSLAFSLFFQAPNRTLTDSEVRGPYEKIVRQLGKELGASLRV